MAGGEPIRVLVVDDHPVVRQGLRSFLSSREGIEVVGEAADGEAAVAEAARLGPDVVLLDLSLPGGGGLDAIGRIRAGGTGPAVLVLTSFSGEDQVLPAVRAGAAGYLLKDVPVADLEAAIPALGSGGAWLDPAVVATVMGEVARPRRPRVSACSPPGSGRCWPCWAKASPTASWPSACSSPTRR